MATERFAYPETDDSDKKEAPFDHYAIEQLREPLTKLINKLAPAFEKGEYDLIIGDDASGRLPALSIWEAAKLISERNDQTNPGIRFFAGSGRLPHEASLDKISKLEERMRDWNKNKKKLIVSEYISTGNSLQPLATALIRSGLKIDIATIRLENAFDRQKIKKNLGGDLYVGEYGNPPAIYSKRSLAGVEKNTYDLYSSPIAASPEDQVIINNAHVQALTLGGQIVEDYISHHDQQQLEKIVEPKNPI